ncbi:ras guanine nucleotide exchange factor domain-containing protein [Mycena albidolilacea]|uniref:Ras guanine nucleotide exchange factor domain-containing protein n=1 Tax=Mycena albidolilacea TaxID=1033008 RepID=A0AAD7AK88_9AGAR|nr:ras guanine nucleotide exchange factor domain-containing protein [Mycena albidolilacea]
MTLAAHSHPRHSLHLNIDASPYDLQGIPSGSNSPSSSARASIGTELTSPARSSMSELVLCSVLCMYDFQSDDADHLEFRKNEILDVVKQEDTGWWAAMRRGGDFIGWIPQAFVNPLTEEMTEKLWNVREELRVYEYDAEQLYNAAPTVRNNEWYDTSPDPSPLPSPVLGNSSSRYPPSPGGRRLPPPSPITPMPQPPLRSAPAYNKPTPPTPDPDGQEFALRPETAPNGRGTRRQPLRVDDPRFASRLSRLMESADLRDSPVSPEEAKKSKIAQLTGSEAAWYDTQIAKANLPPYLLPSYADQLKLDAEGLVRTGTLVALVEKLCSDPLTKDPIKLKQEKMFKDIFLTTFRTFTTANQLFDLLVARYHMERPEHLTDGQAEEWREKMQLPTQRRTLTLLTMWLQDHRLLEEEPHIAQRLTDFLRKIMQPQSLALTAKLIIRSIEDLTFANPTSASPTVPPRKRRKSKNHKNELLRLDPTDIAEQLALLEFKLYAKLTAQECISYAKTQTGKQVENLCAFCATHDKLAAWVKTSILMNEGLAKRADTVELWIKVAEKCRNLNNFASMSAVINALSSTVISRLHLTWAHVGKKSILDGLIKFNDPSGGFSGYRMLLSNAEGPCVPFIGMYLTDIVHISDQFSDHDGNISFLKRQRWYEVVQVMLRAQKQPYNIAEGETTTAFIGLHLKLDSMKDQTWFWEKSQEVQQSELAHADIRKGLEAAGF